MHFCVSATRCGFHCGFCCPRKIGTNWFIPALVKSRLGASGSSDDDGTMVCCFSRKKSRKDCRISAEVMVSILAAENRPRELDVDPSGVEDRRAVLARHQIEDRAH